MKSLAITAAIALLLFVILVYANYDSGTTLSCNILDYLHRQSTVFVCANEPRWGRLP